MTKFYLPNMDGQTKFPPVADALAEPNGLLAFGGNLGVDTLINAYSHGIFPWFSNQEPILWWAPNPRMVLFPHKFHISRSFKRALKKTAYSIHFDRNFSKVLKQCAKIRKDGIGTWITADMQDAYLDLFDAGIAHCLEIDIDDKLIGGIYGIELENIFYGESMFSIQTNGSKIAMFELCKYMQKNHLKILDCQIHNDHLQSLGAELISMREFQQYLPKTNKT